jgi:antibiotic biosynthesis monooxygenase (ABM) superfamily enzyme
VKKQTDETTVVALLTKLKPQPEGDTSAFKEWLVELMMTSTTFPGFWSSEIVPPMNIADDLWTLIQRFNTVEEANAWKHSESLQELMTRNKDSQALKAVVVDDEISTDGTSGMVALAIVTDVIPGEEDFFRQWELKIQKAQAKFPGYQGTYWQAPVAKSSRFTTLLRFATPASLEHWMVSEERKKLVNEANSLISATKISALKSSFPGWFPADPQTGEQPPNWKSSMLVLAAIYPIIMVGIRFISPAFPTLNAVEFTFISTVCNIIILTWICMPILIKLFAWWLFPSPNSKRTVSWTGSFILLAVYSIEVALLWK